jgi:F-type H+-transporting ATPase subunit b
MFDFDATLPLMALQFLLLAAVLNVIFYKPLTKVLDERTNFIRSSKTDAREVLAKTEQLAAEYKQQLNEARKQAQSVITTAQNEAQTVANQKMAEAQKEAQSQREQAQQEIDAQKIEAMRSLEQQVDALGRQIMDKLLEPAR